MRKRPELTKGDYERVIPVHSHLIEQGFLDYVEKRRKSNLPLFYDRREPAHQETRERLTWPRPLSLGARFRRQALAPKGATLPALGLDGESTAKQGTITP